MLSLNPKQLKVVYPQRYSHNFEGDDTKITEKHKRSITETAKNNQPIEIGCAKVKEEVYESQNN